MNFFLIRGTDKSADSGSFTVIVEARNQSDAECIAEDHLKEIGRSDLLNQVFECVLLHSNFEGRSVLYSNAVEGKDLA